MPDLDRLDVRGTLPSGAGKFAAIISRDVIACRAGDRTCVAHPDWMTDEQLVWLRDSLTDLIGGDGDE